MKNASWHRHNAAQKLALHEMNKWGLTDDGWTLSPYGGVWGLDYGRKEVTIDIDQIWWNTDRCDDLDGEDTAIVVDAIRREIARILASSFHDPEWEKAAVMVGARIERSRHNDSITRHLFNAWKSNLPSNKNRLEVQKLALREMNKWGLIDDGWTFYWNTSARPSLLGTCNYSSKSVQLSEHTVDHHYDGVEVVDTIKHEIAHALAGREGPAHGSEWRKAAVMTGARLGHYREKRILTVLTIICVAITIISLSAIAYMRLWLPHIGR